MGVRAQKIRPDRAEGRHAIEDGEDTVLRAREVLETLETGSYVDDDIDAARGLVNAALIGTAVWALIFATYYFLS